MIHPLQGRIAIDVDDQAGIGNIGGMKVEGRPVTVAFFEPKGMPGSASPRATKSEIDLYRSWGKAAGLRFVPSGWGWVDGAHAMSAAEAAKLASDAITLLESDGKRRIDVVEWDVETKNALWQVEFLLGSESKGTKGIRGASGQFPNPSDPSTLGYRWGRPGVWTMEGRQDVTTSVAHLAAKTGLWVGPQIYSGTMSGKQWSWQYELQTWVKGTNIEKTCPPAEYLVPLAQMIPYTDARDSLRSEGEAETVLFATSRATALVGV